MNTFFEILDILYRLTFWGAIVVLGAWAVLQIRKEDILDKLHETEERAEELEKSLSLEKGKNKELRDENHDLLDRLIFEHAKKIEMMRQSEEAEEKKECGDGKDESK